MSEIYKHKNSQMEWDRYWMNMVQAVSTKSKDKSRKIGCIFVDQDNSEVAIGWNGFPRGIDDDVENRHQRPDKYLWTIHAEKNAIATCARKGRTTMGCKAYQALYPCAGCAGLMIQSGIVEIITVEPVWDDPTYSEEWTVARTMLAEAGVKVRFVDGTKLTQQKIT